MKYLAQAEVDECSESLLHQDLNFGSLEVVMAQLETASKQHTHNFRFSSTETSSASSDSQEVPEHQGTHRVMLPGTHKEVYLM